MSKPQTAERAYGPYRVGKRWRLIVRKPGTPDRAESFDSEEEAVRAKSARQVETLRPGQKTAPKQPLTTYVYFLRAADGAIKIGRSVNPLARLSSLQTGASEGLRLLLLAPGLQRHEKDLHRIFAASRKQGEWFHPTDDIALLIRQVSEGMGLAEAIQRRSAP
jgi:hypothetical protein